MCTVAAMGHAMRTRPVVAPQMMATNVNMVKRPLYLSARSLCVTMMAPPAMTTGWWAAEMRWSLQEKLLRCRALLGR